MLLACNSSNAPPPQKRKEMTEGETCRNREVCLSDLEECDVQTAAERLTAVLVGFVLSHVCVNV